MLYSRYMFVLIYGDPLGLLPLAYVLRIARVPSFDVYDEVFAIILEVNLEFKIVINYL